MIPPKPFKFVCSKCDYNKIVIPKSDAMNPLDLIDKCPKCGSKMEKHDLDIFDTLKRLFSK